MAANSIDVCTCEMIIPYPCLRGRRVSRIDGKVSADGDRVGRNWQLMVAIVYDKWCGRAKTFSRYARVQAKMHTCMAGCQAH